jgi:hypothetical protein
MISRPVKYDPQNECVTDGNHNVVLHPWRKVGLPDREFHKVGAEIAECINAYIPSEDKGENAPGLIPAKFEAVSTEDVPKLQENGDSGKNLIAGVANVIVEPRKRRGRPPKSMASVNGELANVPASVKRRGRPPKARR